MSRLRSVACTTSEIGGQALRSADNGRPKYLYDLFEDILIDGVLADAINKRIEAVLNAEVVFMNARGQEEPAIAAMIDTTAWETLIREIMHRLFYGRAGVVLFSTADSTSNPSNPSISTWTTVRFC